MNRVNNRSKRIVVLALILGMTCILVSCGGQIDQPVIDESAIERYSLPYGVTLDRSTMIKALQDYEATVNEALAEQGMRIFFWNDEDDHVHLTAFYTDWKNEEAAIPDAKLFWNVEETFASLYELEQIDAEGNVELTQEDLEEILSQLKETNELG